MLRSKLEKFLVNYWGRDFIAQWRARDSFANGFQVKGAPQVKKIALGVSLNQDFLHHAVSAGADTCLVHHGLDVIFPYSLMLDHLRGRLKLILEKNLNIFAYHGVMDAHPKHGHNVLILRHLGAKVGGQIMDYWGWYGDLPQKSKLTKIGNQCHQLFDHEVFVVGKPDQLVKRIGVCSGGGIPNWTQFTDLLEKGIDLYLTGAISESRPHLFSESGMAYFACGHYATEKIGLFELEKNLKKEFPQLKLEFIDIDNPL